MTSNISYKDTLFVWYNLTPIRGEPTFETLHMFINYIKSNTKSVYSNIGGGAHGHLGRMLIDAQYAFISPTIFVYPTHPGLFISPDGTTAQTNFNMRIAHTKRLSLFQEVMGVEQALVKKQIDTVEEAYLVDIRNRATNSTNNTVVDVLNHLKDNYGQLILHKLLEPKDVIKKKI